ncbi:MAG: flagellar assembly protein FliW [Rickettsiales bacterium]|nr:flagellar assembly protein FliW [Rickettsiales bacterium]
MLNQSGLTQTIPSSVMMMETILTRFGEITVDVSKSMVFPRGLLGMPDKSNFVVAPFPNKKMEQFVLLQSLDDQSLSFIALPLPVDNAIIKAQDLKNASRDVQIPETNLLSLLIVSVHRHPAGVKMSVNARAPVLIDSERRIGLQYVFQQDSYKVQHMLG